jgi:hypothetical protein
MIVEMPYGANFGVEGAKTQEKGAIPMGDNKEDGVSEHATIQHIPTYLPSDQSRCNECGDKIRSLARSQSSIWSCLVKGLEFRVQCCFEP